MFVFLLYWFQLYNGFSGSNALDDLSLIFFNLIFTAAPPVVSAILDKDVPAQELLDKPHLYGSGRNSEVSWQPDVRFVRTLHPSYMQYPTEMTPHTTGKSTVGEASPCQVKLDVMSDLR